MDGTKSPTKRAGPVSSRPTSKVSLRTKRSPLTRARRALVLKELNAAGEVAQLLAIESTEKFAAVPARWRPAFEARAGRRRFAAPPGSCFDRASRASPIASISFRAEAGRTV